MRIAQNKVQSGLYELNFAAMKCRANNTFFLINLRKRQEKALAHNQYLGRC